MQSLLTTVILRRVAYTGLFGPVQARPCLHPPVPMLPLRLFSRQAFTTERGVPVPIGHVGLRSDVWNQRRAAKFRLSTDFIAAPLSPHWRSRYSRCQLARPLGLRSVVVVDVGCLAKVPVVICSGSPASSNRLTSALSLWARASQRQTTFESFRGIHISLRQWRTAVATRQSKF